MNNFFLACAECDKKRMIGFAGMAVGALIFYMIRKKLKNRKIKKNQESEND